MMVISFVLCLFVSADKERLWQDDQKGSEQVYFYSASFLHFLQDLCVFDAFNVKRKCLTLPLCSVYI